MRLSEAPQLFDLRAKLKAARKFEDAVTGYPVLRGGLVVHGLGGEMDLSVATVQALVANEVASITASIEALGVEVDE